MAKSANMLRGRPSPGCYEPRLPAQFASDSNIFIRYPALEHDGSSSAGGDSPAPSAVACGVASPISGLSRSQMSGGSRRGSTIGSQYRPTYYPETNRSHRTFPSRRGRRGSLGGFTRSVRAGRSIRFTSVDGWLLIAALVYLLAIVFGGIDAQQINLPIRMALVP